MYYIDYKEEMNMSEEKQKAEQEAEAKAKVEADAVAAEKAGAETEDKVVSDAKDIVAGMKEANKKKEELLEREEKLQTKKETLNALGGGSPAGTEPPKPVFTDEEKASRKRIKAVGDSCGAAWAKNYE